MAGLVPAIHVFSRARPKTWMPGTSPGMTTFSVLISVEKNYAWLATVLPSAACAAARRAIGTR